MEACKIPDYQHLPPEALAIVKESRVIAMVGASPKPERPSHQVMKYLLEQGFEVIPINPGQKEILGQRCYPRLSELPPTKNIDTVIIFRRRDQVLPVVKEALGRGIKRIWMQEGIENEEAARLARAQGAKVVMNVCFKKVHLLGRKQSV